MTKKTELNIQKAYFTDMFCDQTGNFADEVHSVRPDLEVVVHYEDSIEKGIERRFEREDLHRDLEVVAHRFDLVFDFADFGEKFFLLILFEKRFVDFTKHDFLFFQYVAAAFVKLY